MTEHNQGMRTEAALSVAPRKVLVFCAVGLLAGFLSGFFGIGGGTVIVPVLVLCGFTQRSAAATSLVAILPSAVVGVVAYLLSGAVHYPAAILLACGVIVGAQIGTKLLALLPEKVLRWAFVVCLAVMGAQQFILEPSRGVDFLLTPLAGVGLVLLGVLTGILSGLLGIGGGIIVVPCLTFVFHTSDLTARGTSLLMMIPGTISGTARNRKNKLTDFRAGAIVGVCACLTTTFGKLAVEQTTPKAAAVLFGVYICILIIRSVAVALKKD
jgi:uncharacterized membrane protein YfcA